jgi:hypothetical protein
MKKTLLILLAVGSTACESATVVQRVPGGQVVDLDAGKRLVLQVEGVHTKSGESDGVSKAKDGEPIHRVLRDGDGNVLFAYDLQVSRSGKDGAYDFLLKPAAGKAPTFEASRKVTLNAQDAVRVELMEQQGTGRKVEDVLSLVDTSGSASDVHNAIGAHLRAMHERFYRWVHGD